LTIDFLRQSWHDRVTTFENERYKPPPVLSLPVYIDIETIRKQNWSAKFIILMNNRMVIGHFRYGPVRQQTGYDYIEYLQECLEQYIETGNTEFLVDISNMAMIEFIHKPGNFRMIDGGIHNKRKEPHV